MTAGDSSGWRELHALFTEKAGPNREDINCPRDGFTLLADKQGRRCPFCGWRTER